MVDLDVFRGRFWRLWCADRVDDLKKALAEAFLDPHRFLRTASRALGELYVVHLGNKEVGALATRDRSATSSQGGLPEFYRIVDALIAERPQVLARHTASRASNDCNEGANLLLDVLPHAVRGPYHSQY